jgi:hypothetical protein
MRWLLVLAALGAAGCPKGESLVIVKVDATTTIDQIAVLHATSMIDGITMEHDLGGGADPFTIPPAKTFGIQVQSSLSGSFAVRVEARNAAGRALAIGQGSANISPGERSEIAITLAPVTPIVQSKPVWIGSGGSAMVGSSQLSLGLGGDTMGRFTSSSQSTLSPGFFSALLED